MSGQRAMTQERRLRVANTETMNDGALRVPFEKAEAVQVNLNLDMVVNGTRRRVALNAMRGRIDAYLCELGGGRRALRTKYEYVSSIADWHALPQPILPRPRAPGGRRNPTPARARIALEPKWHRATLSL